MYIISGVSAPNHCSKPAGAGTTENWAVSPTRYLAGIATNVNSSSHVEVT